MWDPMGARNTQPTPGSPLAHISSGSPRASLPSMPSPARLKPLGSDVGLSRLKGCFHAEDECPRAVAIPTSIGPHLCNPSTLITLLRRRRAPPTEVVPETRRPPELPPPVALALSPTPPASTRGDVTSMGRGEEVELARDLLREAARITLEHPLPLPLPPLLLHAEA